MNKTAYTSSVPAVEQAIRVILCLAQDESTMTLTEISKKTGIQKSKAYAILNTLQHLGLVQRKPETKQYSLGPTLVYLGRKASEILSYKEITGPYLKQIATLTRSTTIFGLIEEPYLFVVAKEEGDENFSLSIKLGKRYPLTFGAHGKVILSFLPEQERERILSSQEVYLHGLPQNFDKERFRKEVEECLRKGYGVDIGTFHPKVNAIASPIFGEGRGLVGSLFVVGLFPESAVDTFGSKIRDAAMEISTALGADGIPMNFMRKE
jgi:DNA-binding IclR family transcriptional regulator